LKRAWFYIPLLTGLLFLTGKVSAQMFAIDDVAFTDEDAFVVIDVQANDENIGGGDETTFLFSFPPNGSLELLDNDSIRYTPDPNFFGVDTFSYEVCNGEEPIPSCGIGFVLVTVGPLPDFPIALNDTVSTLIETPLFIDVLENDINLDSEALVALPVVDAENGTAILTGSEFLYSPDFLFTGIDSFSYAACKTGSTVYCDTATVVVEIMPTNFFAPVAVDDQYEIFIGEEIDMAVLANDTDEDGDALYINGLVYTMLNGTVSYNDAIVTYSNLNGFNDSLHYIVCDLNTPQLCDTGRIKVKVIDVRVPDSFSPNGDGINDQIMVEGLDIYPGFTFSVFNRLGQLVFETGDPGFVWNGTVNQDSFLPTDIVSDGTYFYVLDLSEGSDPKTGTIVVKR
jgi:gliding motility-associated-like protein